MDALASLKEAASVIQASLVELTERADRELREAEQAEQRVTDAKIELEGIASESKKQQKAAESKLSEQSAKLGVLIDELNGLTKKIETAKAELEGIKKKHAQFMNYQIKAEKALRAREQSILEREKTLEEIIGQAKRRTSIIGI